MQEFEVNSNPSVTPEPPSNNSKVSLALSFLLGGVATAFALIGFYFFFLNSNSVTSETALTATPSVDTQPLSTPTTVNTFTDPHIQNLSLEFDPTQWQVDANSSDAEIIFTQLEGEGSLTLRYLIPLGVGGGLIPLTEGDLHQVTEDLYRVEVFNQHSNTTTYVYGLLNNETFTDFSQKPEKKQDLLEMCQQAEQDAMYMVLEKEECQMLEQNQYLGYLSQPPFSWSIKRPITTPLGTIKSDWQAFEGTPEDDGTIIIQVEYRGSKPELADQVVAQLTP